MSRAIYLLIEDMLLQLADRLDLYQQSRVLSALSIQRMFQVLL